jgi:hypothetical protein
MITSRREFSGVALAGRWAIGKKWADPAFLRTVRETLTQLPSDNSVGRLECRSVDHWAMDFTKYGRV